MQHSLFDYAAQNNWPTGTFFVMDSAGLRPAQPKEILVKAADLAGQKSVQREILRLPAQVKELFALRLHEALEHEVFAIIFVDAQYGFIAYEEPFRGTLTQATVYPREVVKLALQHNAASVFIAHNHPSGALMPSQADVALTSHLKRALALVDVNLLDHIIVASGKTYSMAEAGMF